MLHFDSDYMQGACSQILARLAADNDTQFTGYGIDPVSESAREKIRAACNAPNAAVYFLAGGTQANVLILDQQFDELFTDGLYQNLGRHAIGLAKRLRKALNDKGYPSYIASPTNQIFIVLNNKQAEELQKQVSIGFWEKYDDAHTVYRFATSWATRPEDIDALIALL